MTEVKEAESEQRGYTVEANKDPVVFLARRGAAPRNRVGWTSTEREVGGTTKMAVVEEAVATR
ncbi:hypothetical protein YC2023_083297 [Brassica napus]